MKRKLFLQKMLAALCAIPVMSRFARAETPDIEYLELDYCKAANALTDYRRRHGFEPGARVQARSRWDDEVQLGTIAPYGERWASVSKMCVQVLLDKGYCQPWNMAQLTRIG